MYNCRKFVQRVTFKKKQSFVFSSTPTTLSFGNIPLFAVFYEGKTEYKITESDAWLAMQKLLCF
jgi:hypothetical protein